jgi:hypothetical protein
MSKSRLPGKLNGNIFVKGINYTQKAGKSTHAQTVFETEEPEADEVKNSSRYDVSRNIVVTMMILNISTTLLAS